MEEDAGLENVKLIKQIEEEKVDRFLEIKNGLQDVVRLFEEEKLSDFDGLIEKWKLLKDEFDKKYTQIKEKASANEGVIKEINKLEIRLREITNSVNERLSRIKELGNPETKFNDEREKWYELHRDKISLLNEQANQFTQLSQGIIQAEVTRNINIDKIRDEIIQSFTGTRISKDKIDNICQEILNSETPLETWKLLLDELRNLAEYRISEDKPIELPDTPILTNARLNEGNKQKIVELFLPENWLKMLTQEIEFEPLFKYSTSNEMGDVIPFSEASAGQQATALLSVLLNQEGTPLLIDQPEDDIDNRAINDIIQNIWSAKNKRQLIFTSHNANLVVNGDAELVVCCDYKESSQQTQGEIKFEGAIDNIEIRNEITSIMEGGEKAFRLRKEKYGF